MNLTSPLALAWLALAVPIVVFYILKIRLRRVPVTTTLFWSQIYEEKRPRSLWRQLRHLLSLLVQLLFLLLVALALTNPSWSWEELQAQRIVLIVDNSASMNATDVSPTRLDAAREQGRRLIRGLRARDEMAILSAGSEPKVASGLTGHQRTLRDALERIDATDGPTRVAAAVELGRRILSGHERGRIIVLSDGLFEQRERLAKDKDIEIITLGTPAANVGITQFQARRSLADSIGFQILLTVRNFSDEPVETRLEIDLDDKIVDVLPLKLAANETFSRALDHVSSEGGRLAARLEHADALVADNRAVALLPRREVQPVLLITQGSHYLQRVLEAMPAVQLSVASVLPERVPRDAVVVYHRRTPEALPRGNVLVIDPTNSCDAWSVGEGLENPLVGRQQSESPLLRHVRMDNVWMPAARKLQFSSQPRTLIAAVTGEALYAAMEGQPSSGPADKRLVLTVDLEKGDLPLRTAFPILMTNALAWFQGTKGELRESLTTGSVYEARLTPESAANGHPIVLRSPREQITPLAVSEINNGSAETIEQTTVIGPLDQAGVWRIERESSGSTAQADARPPAELELAVNLANADESDIRVMGGSSASRQANLAGFGGQPIWFYLTLLAAALISVEWWLYQRRWIS